MIWVFDFDRRRQSTNKARNAVDDEAIILLPRADIENSLAGDCLGSVGRPRLVRLPNGRVDLGVRIGGKWLFTGDALGTPLKVIRERDPSCHLCYEFGLLPPK